MLRNEGDRLAGAVLCPPAQEYFRATDLKLHNLDGIPDPDRTRRQHAGLAALLDEWESSVIKVAELPGHPNSVFTRDTALSTPRGFIRLRMGLESRRGEEEWMAGVLRGLGEPCAGEIVPPGTVEGGDIILAGDVAFIGLSERTNPDGAAQISELLAAMGYETRTTPVRKALHLGGIMSVVGPRRILCCRGLFPEGFFSGFDTVGVPWRHPGSGNVICMGAGEVIANSAENEEVAARLEAAGIRVHNIDLSEFRKGAGGPSCLILPVERREADR